MAVDNRNFVNKFANEGGGDVLVEDKRMEELKSATAKTSSQISTSDNYIPLQDTDGNLVKINPASFEEAVRNVLGGLLANNDKGTTISGVPALSGSGNSLDFGSITPANLASVLGVIKRVDVTLAPNETLGLGDTYTSLLIVGGYGTSFVGTAIFTIGYGTMPILISDTTSNYVGISGTLIKVGKAGDSQWDKPSLKNLGENNVTLWYYAV